MSEKNVYYTIIYINKIHLNKKNYHMSNFKLLHYVYALRRHFPAKVNYYTVCNKVNNC